MKLRVHKLAHKNLEAALQWVPACGPDAAGTRGGPDADVACAATGGGWQGS